MAIDILRNPNYLAESTTTGLDSLIEGKLKGLQHQRKEEALERIGIPKQFASLSDAALVSYMNNKSRAKMAADKMAGQEQFARNLQAYLSGDNGDNQNISPERLLSQQVSQPSEGEILGQNIFGAPARQMTEGEILGQKIFGNNPPLAPNKKEQQLPSQVQQQIEKKKVPNLSGLNPQQALQLAQLGIQKQNLSRKEQLDQQKADKIQNAKAQLQADKETLPYYTKILDEDKAAKKTDIDTQRMIKLIEKGNLPNAAYYKLLKDLEDNVSPLKGAGAGAAIGGGIGTALGGPVGAAGGALLGAGLGAVINPLVTLSRYAQLKKYPDAEEFEKLSNGFISGAKAIFGSRITDQDLRAFMATVPQLSNTESGKRAIIRNIQIMNRASHIRATIMKDIIKNNNGHRPVDLALQVEESASPHLDKLAQDFIG